MKIQDSKKLESLIEQLDERLYKGWWLYQTSFGLYTSSKKDPSFDEKQWAEKTLKDIEEWSESISKILKDNLGGMSHFLYHFVRVRPIRGQWEALPEDLSNLRIKFDQYLDSLENIVARLEEREGLLIRQEIAKQERDRSTLYEMTYSGREIRINGFLLTKPDFMSENDQFFDYIFSRPWQVIRIQDMVQDLKIERFKKSVGQMLADLKITGSIRDVFAPNASSKAIEFRNPISRSFAEEKNLPAIEFSRNDQK